MSLINIIKGKAVTFVESRGFTHFITVVILLNAVTLGLETDRGIMEKYGEILLRFDQLVLTIFVIEILLKLLVYKGSFFRNGWNVFDFSIVGIALLPAVGPLAVLRALRILRVLRLVSVVPQMRRVISALLTAIPGMASIMAVLLIIFYVSAVLATKLFGLTTPDPAIQEQFGTIAASMYTLFQIMTLEGWSQEIVRPVMEYHPHSWLFFIPFIIFTSFAVLNLFIGIIVDAMNMMHEGEREYTGPERRKSQPLIEQDMQEMRAEMAEIRKIIQKQSQ